MANAGQVFPHVVAWLAAYIDRDRPQRVLEAGAGAGQYARHVTAAHYVSFDIPQTWYEIEREPSVYATADALPFRDSAFGLAFCVSAFDYFPNPQVVMSEVARCLEPGATFLVFTYDEATLQQIHERCAALPPGPATAGHHVYDRSRIFEYALDAGFKAAELAYLPAIDLVLRLKLLLRPTNLRVYAFTKLGAVAPRPQAS